MTLKTIFQEVLKEKDSIETFAKSMKLCVPVDDNDEIIGAFPCIENSSTTISAYVDFEMQNGCALTWWSEINETGEGFIFASSHRRNDEEGDHVIEEFKEIIIKDEVHARKLLCDSLMNAKRIASIAENYTKSFRQGEGFPTLTSASARCIPASLFSSLHLPL